MRTLHFVTSNQWMPDPQKNYLILGGMVSHITGTASEFYSMDKFTNGTMMEYIAVIPAATGSTYTPLFAAMSGLGAWHPIVIPAGSGISLYFTGDANAFINIIVLEW